MSFLSKFMPLPNYDILFPAIVLAIGANDSQKERIQDIFNKLKADECKEHINRRNSICLFADTAENAYSALINENISIQNNTTEITMILFSKKNWEIHESNESVSNFINSVAEECSCSFQKYKDIFNLFSYSRLVNNNNHFIFVPAENYSLENHITELWGKLSNIESDGCPRTYLYFLNKLNDDEFMTCLSNTALSISGGLDDKIPSNNRRIYPVWLRCNDNTDIERNFIHKCLLSDKVFKLYNEENVYNCIISEFEKIVTVMLKSDDNLKAVKYVGFKRINEQNQTVKENLSSRYGSCPNDLSDSELSKSVLYDSINLTINNSDDKFDKKVNEAISLFESDLVISNTNALKNAVNSFAEKEKISIEEKNEAYKDYINKSVLNQNELIGKIVDYYLSVFRYKYALRFKQELDNCRITEISNGISQLNQNDSYDEFINRIRDVKNGIKAQQINNILNAFNGNGADIDPDGEIIKALLDVYLINTFNDLLLNSNNNQVGGPDRLYYAPYSQDIDDSIIKSIEQKYGYLEFFSINQ